MRSGWHGGRVNLSVTVRLVLASARVDAGDAPSGPTSAEIVTAIGLWVASYAR
jgi:hypothetical protein